MTDKNLQWLIDRADITDTVHKYATGIDLHDWTTYRSIFADEVEFDFSSFEGQPATTMKADDWVAQVRSVLSGFDATQHVLTNHVIDIDGDRARTVVYMKAEHFLANDRGDNSIALGGYYTHELTRQPNGWKITKCKLTVTWNRGNRHLFQMAALRAAS